MPLEGTYEPSTRDISREQVELYERSNGAEGNTRHGLPVVIVTSIGARSRALRKTPLMRVEHQGRYALVASLGGGPRHPVWYQNLRANPRVELQDGSAKVDYLAREVTGSERDDWWNRAVAAFPMYADYQEQTDRIIPVFVLEPMCGVQRTESSAPGLDEDSLP
ncbi:nitroreductase family deazaflavin-dependent oxidoreductase [Rhodococcus opacus]|uniref:nitroreductase family deazaflavin-dependent oxidoreductase n=1 Tax=Rhodococcus opacus TaxID=37919 RepID=UPI0024750F93|nr:nitroreductase family deazaflavin-dependent oxidoreductase [Rhodococcus opacus]MDH6292489.1 deazaflavin-dependent oxidoreductase (nitroreductase family) [Rhodococcus opacus]